ncbi:uncharacterized protein [Miscanthus floridulus]|uniref:uncharacterized protein n=1 Tax=Miscanthus floridulus TaxID=154761 RepID=UPI00345938D9
MVADGNLSNANEGGRDDNRITVDEVVNSGEAAVIGGQEGGETGGLVEDGKSIKIGVQDGESQDTHPPSDGDKTRMVVDENLSNADEGGEDDNWITVDEVVNSSEASMFGGQEGGETGGGAEDGNKFTDEEAPPVHTSPVKDTDDILNTMYESGLVDSPNSGRDCTNAKDCGVAGQGDEAGKGHGEADDVGNHEEEGGDEKCDSDNEKNRYKRGDEITATINEDDVDRGNEDNTGDGIPSPTLVENAEHENETRLDDDVGNESDVYLSESDVENELCFNQKGRPPGPAKKTVAEKKKTSNHKRTGLRSKDKDKEPTEEQKFADNRKIRLPRSKKNDKGPLDNMIRSRLGDRLCRIRGEFISPFKMKYKTPLTPLGKAEALRDNIKKSKSLRCRVLIKYTMDFLGKDILSSLYDGNEVELNKDNLHGD